MKKMLLAGLCITLTACQTEESSSQPPPPITQPPPVTEPPPLPEQPSAVTSNEFTQAFSDYLSNGILENNYYLTNWSVAGNKISPTLPLDEEYPTFYVDDFGAIPNNGLDDLDAIQSAIAAAKSAGGGYIIFSGGQYDLNVDDDSEFTPDDAIWVNGSHIFLLGSDDETNKTIIRQHKHVTKTGGAFDNVRSDHTINFGGEGIKKSVTYNLQSDTQQGDTLLSVASPQQFKVGDSIEILMMSWRPPKPPESEELYQLEELLLYPLYYNGQDREERQSQPRYQPFFLHREVVAIHDNGIEVDDPISRDLPLEHNPVVYIRSYDITDCGAKNLTLIGPHDGSYAEGGYDSGGINFQSVRNCWAENLTLQDHVLDVSLNSSRDVTVRNIKVEGTRGHHGIGIYGSFNNLVEHVDYHTSREHMITFNGSSSHNAIRDVDNQLATTPGSMGIDFHSGFSSFNLLENITNTKISSRGALGHNASSGQYNVLWNVTKGNPQQGEGWGLFHYCLYTSTGYHGFREKFAECYRRHPRTLYIGLKTMDYPIGKVHIHHETEDHIDEWKYVEGLNTEGVYPKSLYQAQRHQDAMPYPHFDGIDTVQVDIGSNFDALAGVSVSSDVFGDLTDNIVVSGEVDTSVAQTYTLSYHIVDDLGLKSTIERYVVVR